MTDDFYSLLDVPEDASQTEIRAAFRHKVQEYHPDHNDDPRATAQFTALKMSYDTLGDETERKAYDRLGHEEYVSERLDGLPDPDQWPSTGEGEGETDSGGRTSKTSTTSTATSQSSTSSGSGGSAAGANASASTGDATGRRTTTDGGGAATATGASGRTRTGTTRSEPSGFERFLYHDAVQWLVGWNLLYFSVLVYVAGLGAYAVEQESALRSFVDRVSTAGTDPGTIASVLNSREALVPVSEFLLDGVPAASPPAILLAVGIVFYPIVMFVLVTLTRRAPGWRPTYMYVLATLGPALGVLTALAVDQSVFSVAGDLLLFVVVPIGTFLAMLFSAHLRPVIKRRLGVE